MADEQTIETLIDPAVDRLIQAISEGRESIVSDLAERLIPHIRDHAQHRTTNQLLEALAAGYFVQIAYVGEYLAIAVGDAETAREEGHKITKFEVSTSSDVDNLIAHAIRTAVQKLEEPRDRV